MIVTVTARSLWRRVGTTAWAVLLDVALDAQFDPDGRLVAATNVRRLAGHLGISKDTAARALVRLVDAGLLVRQHGRRGANGEFTPSVYELCLDRCAGIDLLLQAPVPEFRRPVVKVREAEPVPAPAASPAERVRSDRRESRARRGGRGAVGPAQRSLFEASGDVSERR